jgi:hypothetical protein
MMTDVLPDLGRMIAPVRPIYGAARQERREREEELAVKARELLGDRLKYQVPDQETLECYAQEFREFLAWAQIFGYGALPASGPVAATYLMALVAAGSLPKVQGAARAIAFFHDAFGHYLDDAYVQAALVWATQWCVGARLLSEKETK